MVSNEPEDNKNGCNDSETNGDDGDEFGLDGVNIDGADEQYTPDDDGEGEFDDADVPDSVVDAGDDHIDDGDDADGEDIVDVVSEHIESTKNVTESDPGNRRRYDDVPDVPGVTIQLAADMYSSFTDVFVAVKRTGVDRDDVRSVVEALPHGSQEAKISDVIVVIDDRPGELHDAHRDLTGSISEFGEVNDVMGVTADGDVETADPDDDQDFTRVDTSHIDEPEEGDLGPGETLLDAHKPNCPRCGKTCKSDRGVRVHFGKAHSQYELADDRLEIVNGPDIGGDDADDDGDECPMASADPFDPPGLEDEDNGDDGADGGSESDRKLQNLWDTAREKFNEVGISGYDTTRRDAIDAVIDALEAQTEWMSIHERSDKDTTNLWRWDDDDGWVETGEMWIQTKLSYELGADGGERTAEKAAYHLSVRNRVREDDLNAANYDGKYVAFENGLVRIEDAEYDAETGEVNLDSVTLIEETPEHRMLRTLPVEWDPDAADIKFVEGWMKDLTGGDETKTRTMWEAGGHALLPGYEPQAFIIVIAEGRNGKTTMFNAFQRTLGEENTSAIPLDKITGSNFSAYRMVDRLANMHADISGTNLGDVSTLKAATGDDRMEVERKGKDPWDASNRATQIMAANSPPSITEVTKAVQRRLMPVILDVEFVNDPDPEDPKQMQKDPDVKDELNSDNALAAIAAKFVEGARRLQEQDDFTMGIEFEADERLQIYQSSADPIADFERTCLEVDPDGPGIAIDDIKACYDAYARKQDHPAKTRPTLTKMLRKRPTTVIRKTNPRTWTDDDSRPGVYKGMKFTAEAKEHYLPEDAFWGQYGRPESGEADGDGETVNDGGDGVASLQDVREFEPGRYDDTTIEVNVAHSLDPKPWLTDEAVVEDGDDTMRVQSIGEHVLEAGDTVVISDFTIVPVEGDTQIQLVPAQTNVEFVECREREFKDSLVETRDSAIDEHADDDADDDDAVEDPKEVIETIIEEHDGSAQLDTIRDAAVEAGIDEDRFEHEWAKLQQQGKVYDAGADEWRAT
jgi:P4 family phage/plasmid primase-like protien